MAQPSPKHTLGVSGLSTHPMRKLLLTISHRT
jgi:hypothetical protein